MNRESSSIIPFEPQQAADDSDQGVKINFGSFDGKRQEEHAWSVECGAKWILGRLETNISYGERIPLKRDRTFAVPGDVTEPPGDAPQILRAADKMEYSQKGLYDLAREIRLKHPELRFTFKLDPDGEWIEYNVKKQVLKVGDRVVWELDGVVQWDGPKKIVSIEEDSGSGRKYAFFENSATGIPLDELCENIEL